MPILSKRTSPHVNTGSIQATSRPPFWSAASSNTELKSSVQLGSMSSGKPTRSRGLMLASLPSTGNASKRSAPKESAVSVGLVPSMSKTRHWFPMRSVSPHCCSSKPRWRASRSSRNRERRTSTSSQVRAAKKRESVERAGKRSRPKSAIAAAGKAHAFTDGGKDTLLAKVLSQQGDFVQPGRRRRNRLRRGLEDHRSISDTVHGDLLDENGFVLPH